VFRRMGLRSLDLHKTFRANRLVTAAGGIEIWGIVQKADGAFRRIFVQKHLDGLPVD
jgi:hypothetical protein